MDAERLSIVRIVLVETSHPGNIGAVARAMKAMRLDHLVLVRPKRFPCADATARAAGADDLLARATVCDTLDGAIAGCGLIIGTSARPRRIGWPVLAPRECATRMLRQSMRTDVALIFGREHSGLTNTELDRCHALVMIPTNTEFSSLNLAAAVQILAYELHLASGAGGVPVPPSEDEPASAAELRSFYDHSREALVEIGFFDPDVPKLLMRRLRRLFNRVQPARSEINILRGILSAAQRAARKRR